MLNEEGYLISINEKTQGKKKTRSIVRISVPLFFFLKNTKNKIKGKLKRGSK
jgi:hypothetical protein